MKTYYDRRAFEYDDWWLGRGLFEARERPGWDAEVGRLAAFLRTLPPARILDVACGTGFLTRHLPGDVTALDQSERMLAEAAGRAPNVQLVQGDALELPFPERSFARIFTSYFYCHLEAEERARFLGEARRVAAELVVVASRPRGPEPRERWEKRTLNDGSRWRVYKRVFEPEELADELGGEPIFAGEWFVVVRAPLAPLAERCACLHDRPR